MMRWTTTVLALVVLCLVAWLSWSARSTPERRAADDHIRRPTTLAVDDVVLVGVDLPATGEQFLYTFDGEHWRCRNAGNAMALDLALVGLIEDLTQATGTTREVADARLAAYGLGEDAPRVTLFGAAWRERDDRDELATFRLGGDVQARRSYARLDDSPLVWELDRLPRRHLAREAGDRLPPMLDRRLLAGELPAANGGFTRAFLDFADGSSFELARTSAETYAWELRTPQGEPVPALPYRVAGWQSFVYRTPYAGFAAPSEAPRVGLESAWLTITLIDGAGAIELQVAEPAAGTPLAVLNSRSEMLVLLAPDAAALLVPTTDDFVDRARANRWEDWLGAGAIRR